MPPQSLGREAHPVAGRQGSHKQNARGEPQRVHRARYSVTDSWGGTRTRDPGIMSAVL